MIALAGPNLPHDVITASQRGAGPLGFDPDRDSPRARQWLETKFAPWAPPVLEAWLGGEYDHLDHVLFSRAEDTSQRLYYYCCELQRRGLLGGPRPLIFDIAKIPRPASLDRTVTQVRELMRFLEVTEDALEEAIVRNNRQRALKAPETVRPICLLTGTAPPDRRLHSVIAGAGFEPSARTLAEDWVDLGEPVAEGTGDPARAVGSVLHARGDGPRSFSDPARHLAAEIERRGASAVIHWRIEEDEAQTWHLPAERRVLEASGLPSLVLTRRDWLCRDGAVDEIGAFLEGVGA
ncbi:hypothetical protein FHS61_001996 [Altererythrobacter atlanticus]|uniref:Uncharacterized protein n=1 Tax=Croceibacterium atlanticum TaxID=1267766 RepID=A0A0F7KLU7_9SPHN|nr:2-hydroxyacyl-CoA dehydratase family protein [Croceibacterium atlanticum]AKH41508.1 hypothetical protein WYH_00449 [Croceibacterium atlanticum]MBB5732970.1 hypothetical protein [Croceibacterium atlanticum]